MNLEREDKPNLVLIGLSTFLLWLLLFVFFQYRGEVGNEESLARLANLKSIAETNLLREQLEPLPILVSLFLKKIFSLKIITTYNLSISLIYSFFLHVAMLSVSKKEWKLNHFFIVYLVSILPFCINLPYTYLEEMLSFSFLLLLYRYFQLETVLDLLLIFVLVLLSFLSHLLMFLTGLVLISSLICLKFMKEKRSKVTVFFKRKNIPLRIMLFIQFSFVIMILLFTYLDFYGKSSLGFQLKEIWEYIYRFSPIFILFILGVYLLRSERELNTLGMSAIVLVTIVVVGYFSFKTHFETTVHYKNIETELLSLSGRGKITLSENVIHGLKPYSDYIYYRSGNFINFKSIDSMKKKDYYILSNLNSQDEKYFDRKIGNFPLDSFSILISKEQVDKILNEKDTNEIKIKLVEQFNRIRDQNHLYTSYCKSLSSFFGLK
ncbi:MAG: hypothetical protein SFU98_01745 [Leptospiraceae bacterium]|nr:hypothetical protein [Leptospiraceae bacterium]